MVASMFVSRLLGLLRDTVIASHFGLGDPNDAYRIATQIPDLVFMLIAGGGLSSAFIPVFADFWHTDRRREAWKVFSVVVTVCSLGAVAIIGVAWALAPTIVARYAGPKVQLISDALLMSRILLPAQFAFLIGSILIGTLYARKQFIVPGLAPNVYNIGIIVGAAILPGIFGLGVVGIAWGAMVGAIIGNLLLPVIAMIKLGGIFRPSLDLKVEGVDRFFKLLLPVILGFSLPSMVNLVTQYFASAFGEGSNTAIASANNLMQAPLGIFGQSLALAAFPVLSEFYAQKRIDLYRKQVSKTMRTVLYLCIPSSVLMFAAAPWIVQIILRTGKASNDLSHLSMIANCLQIYCVAIAAWCLQPVLMRGFFSLHKTFKPIALGTAMTAIFIGMCFLNQSLSFGLYGLPIATDMAAILLVVILFFALEKEVGKLDRYGILKTAFRSALCSIPLGLVAYLGSQIHLPGGKLISILWFLVVCAGAGWAYYGGTRWYRMPETEYIDRALQKFQRRKSASG